MKKNLLGKFICVLLCALLLCAALPAIFAAGADAGRTVDGMPAYAPNGNTMLAGSNIFNFEPGDSFASDAGRQASAKTLLGVLRFPVRTNTPAQCANLAKKIKGLGIEPLVILPAKTTVDSNLAQIKAMKGTATYYEFGNENNYGDNWSGDQYAKVWGEHIAALRKEDPGMKIGGPVVSHFDTSGSLYVSDFLRAVKNKPELWPDFISLHVYAEHGEDTSDAAVIAKAKSWGQGIDAIRADCKKILGVELPIAVTEWNWDAVPEKTGDARIDDEKFITEFTSTVLDTFKSHGVWMSCQFMFAGTGFLTMAQNDGSPRAQYRAMAAWEGVALPEKGPLFHQFGDNGAYINSSDMTLTAYGIDNNSAAASGKVIKLAGYGVTGTASFGSELKTDLYDINVKYFDEGDGKCRYTLYLKDKEIDAWTADKSLGSNDAVTATLTGRTITNVLIHKGDTLKFSVKQDGEEWGRIDRVEFHTSNKSPLIIESAQPPATTAAQTTTTAQITTEAPAVTEAPAGPQFTDIDGNWSRDNILFLASKGIITGKTPTEFKPADQVTRAEFVTLLSRIKGLDITGYETSSLADVKNEDWFAPYVIWAVNNKIATDVKDNKFGPDVPITREQMTVMLANYAGWAGVELPKAQAAEKFSDESQMDPGSVASIYAVQRAGIVEGKGNGVFDPKGLAGRDEAAKIIRMMYDMAKS